MSPTRRRPNPASGAGPSSGSPAGAVAVRGRSKACSAAARFGRAGHSARARPPEPGRLVRFLRDRPDVTLAPPALLKLELKPRPAARRPAVGRPGEGAALPGPTAPRGRVVASLRRRDLAPGESSWWTARAREGEVKPGFTKEEILRPAREDPRAPDGVLTRVGELLSRLLELS